MKLKTSTCSFRYSDIMVVCDNDFEDKYFKTKPVILVEVLSRSTCKTDEKEMQFEYINTPTLKEYLTPKEIALKQNRLINQVFSIAQQSHIANLVCIQIKYNKELMSLKNTWLTRKYCK